MTASEKREILLQAKTQDFANKYGKHRHAHVPRSTPPGFWRAEMPTTQELQEDKEEARRLERLRVEERYREAMRGNARWKFRDE
jgi:hypothetical protein